MRCSLYGDGVIPNSQHLNISDCSVVISGGGSYFKVGGRTSRAEHPRIEALKAPRGRVRGGGVPTGEEVSPPWGVPSLLGEGSRSPNGVFWCILWR